jgi:hypothetical protein
MENHMFNGKTQEEPYVFHKSTIFLINPAFFKKKTLFPPYEFPAQTTQLQLQGPPRSTNSQPKSDRLAVSNLDHLKALLPSGND